MPIRLERWLHFGCKLNGPLSLCYFAFG
jgi:hypothetical protein